jgi:hypothetical protein
MKKLVLAAGLLAATSCFNFARAQVNVNVSFNVETQPEWGPAGYNQVNYYYLPDIETYYYVPGHQFVYINAGRWVFANTLPEKCRNYNLYRGYKVVINEPRPYLHHEEYRSRYAHYRGYYDHQTALRAHGNKHYEHDEDGPVNGHGHGHAYGHYKKDHDQDGK